MIGRSQFHTGREAAMRLPSSGRNLGTTAKNRNSGTDSREKTARVARAVTPLLG